MAVAIAIMHKLNSHASWKGGGATRWVEDWRHVNVCQRPADSCRFCVGEEEGGAENGAEKRAERDMSRQLELWAERVSHQLQQQPHLQVCTLSHLIASVLIAFN